MSKSGGIDDYIIRVREREEKILREFLDKGLFEADRDENKPKFFLTFPYPYMNGSLHLGHAYSAGRLDVVARYKRLKGYNVLYPWAWHWTGEAVYGTVYRVKMGDQAVINRLISLDRVPPNMIDNLKDPINFVKFFTDVNRRTAMKYFLSVDWRREFHTTYLHPLYNKFIEWQIRKLYERGYIVKGSHPVVWCPTDLSPTGDHDRLTGEGVRPEEYFLVKFRFGDGYLVAGTLRPETIYGVTNIWLNPEAEYVKAEVNGEYWIISRNAAEKLSNQLYKVKIIEKIDHRRLFGKYVDAPLINRRVPILPAKFVDPDVVTGVVYSVPAHAPYDYIALKDLERDERFSEIVSKIVPIVIIKVSQLGDVPAETAIKKFKVSNQLDYEKLDKATKEVYSLEYHQGKMLDNTGPISGMSVSEAKEIIKSILLEEGLGGTMYDLPEKVICRCGTKCIVKILPDQWFLKYSDPNWKRLAHEAVETMSFYPPEIKNLFNHYIDWYHDWPCTRRTGLGTPFPYDREWIVETLTDSTIYNAFYIVSKYYNEGMIDVDKVDDEFFDYIFLGIGDPEKLASKLGISKDLLMEIRDDFLYWYPVDLRGSGKDLIGNHLTFYIFHHVAIFPREKWPRGISVNGFMLLNGRPMSKSKGNYMSMEEAIEHVGVDALRLSLLSLVDGMDDPDWSLKWAYSILNRLHNLEDLVETLWSNKVDRDKNYFDELIYSEYQNMLDVVEEKLENLEIASAAREIFFDFMDRLKNYLYFVDKPHVDIVNEVIPGYVVLLSMYTPYLAEYLWRDVLKMDGYAYNAGFPEKKAYRYEPIMIDKYLNEVVEDVKKIVRVVNREFSKIVIVTASDAKWKLFKMLLRNYDSLDMGKIMRFIRESNMIDKREYGPISKFIAREWYGRYVKFRELMDSLDSEREYSYLKSLINKYIRRVGIDVDVEVYREEEYQGNKLPYPLYPSIYVI